MSRHAPKPGMTPQLMRHFAIVTIGVTACLGMFTNGEEAEQIAKDIDAQQRQAASQVATAVEKQVTPVNKVNTQFRDARRNQIPMAADVQDSGSYGQPMDTSPASSGGGGSSAIGFGEAPSSSATELRPNQLAERGAAISLDQAAITKAGELPTNRRSPGQQRRPTQQQRDQLEAASAARSGSG